MLYREESGWRTYELVDSNGKDVKVSLPSGKLSSF